MVYNLLLSLLPNHTKKSIPPSSFSLGLEMPSSPLLPGDWLLFVFILLGTYCLHSNDCLFASLVPLCAMVQVCRGIGVLWYRCAMVQVCHGTGVLWYRCAVV